VVPSLADDVDLVPATRTVVGDPELGRLGVQCGALGIAVPVGPDLGPSVLAIDERIVVRCGAIRIDPHDLAPVPGQILRIFHLKTLAEGYEQLAVRRDHDARAEMHVAVEGRQLPEDDAQLLKSGLSIALGETSARHGRAVPAAFTRL